MDEPVVVVKLILLSSNLLAIYICPLVNPVGRVPVVAVTVTGVGRTIPWLGTHKLEGDTLN